MRRVTSCQVRSEWGRAQCVSTRSLYSYPWVDLTPHRLLLDKLPRTHQTGGMHSTNARIPGIRILHETAHELVVIKPSGMASELTTDPKQQSLIARVRKAAPAGNPKLPHRLDRITRGLVLIARSGDAISFHNEQIRQGNWGKLYLARALSPLRASPEDLVGMHRLHLKTQAGRARVVRSGGKRSDTEILAVAPAADREDEIHLLIRLHTGRFHQIRATLAHLGVPMVDDWIYSSSPGRSKERFYLEHIALRCRCFGQASAQVFHWHEDPNRESIDPGLHRFLDDFLAQWTSGG